MKKILSLAILGVLFLSGCQSATKTDDKPSAAENKSPGAVQNAQPIQSHGEPFSKGPDAPPALKGPTAPPPQAQAVTKNENIRLTLPLKST